MTIAEQIGKFEPALQHRFKFFIDQVGGSALQGAESLELAVTGLPLPKVTHDEITIQSGGEKIYYAGGVTYEAAEITFRDYVDNLAARTLSNWARLVYDPVTGSHGYRNEYAGTARIQQIGPDGTTVIREWKLINIWPSAFTPGTLAMDNNDPVQISVTFRYDKAVPVVI